MDDEGTKKQISAKLLEIGFTNSTLKYKINLLNHLWKLLIDRVNTTSNKILDYLDEFITESLDIVLKFINVFLSSLKHAFGPLEALKEFKDSIEIIKAIPVPFNNSL